MDKYLTNLIWRLREKNIKQSYPHPVNLIYTAKETYQLYFATVGCLRACSMCNYGICQNFNEEEAKRELDNMIFPEDISIIVLEASGSFLDEREISKELRKIIFQKIATIKTLKFIDIETHYTTITDSVLNEISEIFKDYPAEVEFEFGIESVDSDVLRVYNKDINLNKLLDIIYKIEKYGYYCELNFLIGAPTLTVREQIEDTLNSIKWMIENCPDGTIAVLFPINVKEYTLIGELYKKGKYDLVYQWAFIEVLSRIPTKYLDRISIAWWGNRVNVYDGPKKIKHPYSCDKCHDELQEFYNKFYLERRPNERKKLLQEINQIQCECRKEFLQKLEKAEKLPTKKERFENLIKWLREEDANEE